MADGRHDAVLGRYVAGDIPANIALMQLIAEAESPAEIEAALAARAGEDGIATLHGLFAGQARAFATVKAVLAEADHAGGAGLEGWRAVFDRLAEVAPEAGVALYGLGSPELLGAATEEVVERMRLWGLLGPERRMVEIGCGIGRLSLALAPHLAEVVGLDLSGAMVAQAARRGTGQGNARFLPSSGRDLAGIADASVDLVLAADVFPYLVAAEEGLAERHVAEAARVLRPGGALLILNYSYRGDDARDAREVTAAFAANGLRMARSGVRALALWDAAAYLGTA